jgi:phosphoglycerate dehydrogenase-like enzyme
MGKGVVFICRDYSLEAMLSGLERRLRRDEVDVVRGSVDDPEWLEAADVAVFTSRVRCSTASLRRARRLRGIVFPSSGTDAIDVAAASREGIAVGYGAVPENHLSLAEATVLLILALLYDLHGTEDLLRQNLPRPAEKKASMLMGKRVGLIGFGRIATGVVERLRGWDADVAVFDHRASAKPIPSWVRVLSLDELLATSDIVSLHATLNSGTAGLIGERQLGLMKPTAFLVNTARGGLVDEEALCAALRDRRIAGAALDSFCQEPLSPDSELRRLPNVILTPHMIGSTRECFARLPDVLYENVTALLNGEPPVVQRNPEVLPAWRTRMDRLASRGERRSESLQLLG